MGLQSLTPLVQGPGLSTFRSTLPVTNRRISSILRARKDTTAARSFAVEPLVNSQVVNHFSETLPCHMQCRHGCISVEVGLVAWLLGIFGRPGGLMSEGRATQGVGNLIRPPGDLHIFLPLLAEQLCSRTAVSTSLSFSLVLFRSNIRAFRIRRNQRSRKICATTSPARGEKRSTKTSKLSDIYPHDYRGSTPSHTIRKFPSTTEARTRWQRTTHRRRRRRSTARWR